MSPSGSDSETNDNRVNAIPLWVRAFVIASSILMVMGGLIALVRPAMLISPETINGGAKIYAGYFVARNVALGLFLPLLLFVRARHALASMMMLLGGIQIFDVVMDCLEGRWMIVPGVLVLGTLYFAAAWRVSGAPFWRRESLGD